MKRAISILSALCLSTLIRANDVDPGCLPAAGEALMAPADTLQVIRRSANPAAPVADPAHLWRVDWGSEVHALGSTGAYLPFWQRTGHDGLLPVTTGGLVSIGTDLSYQHPKGWHFAVGTNLAANLAHRNEYQRKLFTPMVDRLYVKGGWRMLELELGLLPKERTFTAPELSLSGGNFMWSGNARNLPGVNFKLDWLYFEKGQWFGIKANFAHYQFIDPRSTMGTMLHDKSLFIKVACGRKVDFILGIEHMAQWGGTAPDGSRKPASWKDYWRIINAQSGGEDASESDQINVLGNHLGHEVLRVDWRAEPFTMTFQYDKPFEDGTSSRFQNVPDGLWSLVFRLKDRKAAVTDLTFEFLTTKWQSGPAHDRPATPEEIENPGHLSIRENSQGEKRVILGGCDNYFNNSEYRSGWTNYGRVIGLPLLTPRMPDENGIARGIGNNRVRAYHFGMAGYVYEGIPYLFKSTFSKNFGIYHEPADSFYSKAPWQLSLALEFSFEKAFTNLPVVFSVGAYGDLGQHYRKGVGLTLRLTYGDFRRF